LTRFFGVLTLALTIRTYGAAGPATLQNDDSCDISITPAATLLLPYFDVDADRSRFAATTIFSVTNVTNVAQIARVTLWTDHAYPVISFNIYLTGYDVQSIDLHDVIMRGVIGPRLGTGVWISPEGEQSDPNRQLDLSECGVIPPQLDASMMLRMQQAFLLGTIGGGCNAIGEVNERLAGYATIDVVGNCKTRGPTDPAYFTDDIRFDNVLIGDSQLIDVPGNHAQASPMVHIRAIPEGGTPRTRVIRALNAKRFGRTFYGRFQDEAHQGADARQPLPSTFAARWISGGLGSFDTSLKIWREGTTGATSDCAAYRENGRIAVTEIVAFDDDENGEGIEDDDCDGFEPCLKTWPARTPICALLSVTPGSKIFRQSVLSNSNSGWLYLNFDDDIPYGYDSAGTPGGRQAWVVVSMRAEGRYSVDFDAAWLGNGCSPAMPRTGYSFNGPGINNPGPQAPNIVLPGPAPDVNPPLP
jgi:hypothetical protein